MKRVFGEKHIGNMLEFMRKHLPAHMRSDIEETRLATRLLTLMDVEQIRLLSIYFENSDESKVTEELKKMGFESNVSMREKRDILLQAIRAKLTAQIVHNSTLLDQEGLFNDIDTNSRKKEIFDGFTGYKKLIDKATKIGSRKRLNGAGKEASTGGWKPRTNMFGTILPKRTPYLGLYDQNEISYQLSVRNLPLLDKLPESNKDDVPPPEDVDVKKKRHSKVVSIYDMVDNSNVILRKKKILCLDPSGPIDYHSDNKFILRDIKDDVQAIPEVKFGLKTYEKFNLRSFIEYILYIRNRIVPPQESKFKTPKEFRRHVKGDRHFFKHYIVKCVAKLLMSQDKYLTYSDAKMISREIRENLQMKDYEYFYDLYFKSADFRPN